MKKTMLIILLCSSVYFPLLAQESKTSLSVKVGPAIPLNELGSDRFANTSGFADIGRSIGLGFNTELTKHLYISVNYINNSYSINREKFDAYSIRTIQRDIIANGGVVSDQFSLSSSLKNYANNNISLGFRFDINLNEKARAYIQPSVSYDFFKVPQLSIVVRDSSFQIASSQSEATSSTIGYNLATGIIYKMNEDLALSLNGTLLNAKHEPLIKARAIDQNGNRVELEQKEKINYAALIFSIGIEIKL